MAEQQQAYDEGAQEAVSRSATLDWYAQEGLPTAMLDLHANHKYVNNVIEYCESAYVQQSKPEIAQATKKYVADALGAVAANMECVAANLTKFMLLQSDEIETIQSNVDLATARLKLAKEQHAVARMNAMYEKTHTVELPAKASTKLEGRSSCDFTHARLAFTPVCAHIDRLPTNAQVRACLDC